LLNAKKTGQFFADRGLGTEDLIWLLKCTKLLRERLPGDRCWCLDKINHPFFHGFTLQGRGALKGAQGDPEKASGKRPMYRGRDARSLILAITGRYGEPGKVVVRTAACKSFYCINPTHYYWGTKGDVQLERLRRGGTDLPNEVIKQVREARQSNAQIYTYQKLAEEFDLSYSVIRGICTKGNYQTTEAAAQETAIVPEKLGLSMETLTITEEDTMDYSSIECIWGHKGRFGLMGECLDCMEEIAKGKCEINLKSFAFDKYWTVRSFWDKVNIPKDQDTKQCWSWGGGRKPSNETVAYMPSPFHSAKAQTAPRVAFWVARGYTGKYRIQHANKNCESGCCNPTHLTIKGLKLVEQPEQLTVYDLSYGNIFEQVRKASAEAK
jgi:hypothetical protein